MNGKQPQLTEGQKAGAYAITHILKETVKANSKRNGSNAPSCKDDVEDAARVAISSVCRFVKEAENPEDAACTIKIQAAITLDQINMAMSEACRTAHRNLNCLPERSQAKRHNGPYFAGKGHTAALNALSAAIASYEEKPENGASRAKEDALRSLEADSLRIKERSKKAKRPQDAANRYSAAAIEAKNECIETGKRMLDWIAETAFEAADSRNGPPTGRSRRG